MPLGVRHNQRMCPTQRDDPKSVLGRAGALLDAFDQQNSRLSVSQLARRTGLPKSTVHRLTTELRSLGWLELHDGRVQLGMRLFEYGLQVPRGQSLREAALPFMEDLRDATGFRVHLAVLEHIEVVYLEILQAKAGPSMASRTGGRLPAHATGLGKAMLAFAPPEVVQARVEAGLPRLTPYTICTPGGLIRDLTKIRADGVAFDREENRLGVSCAAAPIVGAEGACLGALSVSGATSRLDPARMGPAVQTAALALSRSLRRRVMDS